MKFQYKFFIFYIFFWKIIAWYTVFKITQSIHRAINFSFTITIIIIIITVIITVIIIIHIKLVIIFPNYFRIMSVNYLTKIIHGRITNF